MHFSDKDAYMILGYIWGFYFLAFVAYSLRKVAHQGDLTSVSNAFKAVLYGLCPPFTLLIVGALGNTGLWALQEPPVSVHADQWEPDNWLSLFAYNTLLFQLPVLLCAILTVGYYAGRLVRRHFRPVKNT
jgi:hypothetical protein